MVLQGDTGVFKKQLYSKNAKFGGSLRVYKSKHDSKSLFAYKKPPRWDIAKR